MGTQLAEAVMTLSTAGAVAIGVMALLVIATAYIILEDYRSGENWWED
jgi:hypothetical protein